MFRPGARVAPAVNSGEIPAALTEAGVCPTAPDDVGFFSVSLLSLRQSCFAHKESPSLPVACGTSESAGGKQDLHVLPFACPTVEQAEG